MNRHSIIRHIVLCGALAGALVCPALVIADLCTNAGLPTTVNATYLGFGGGTKGGNLYATFSTCASSTSTSCNYQVTRLAASGFGTLADAISQPNRYITFTVGGSISLSKGILLKGANITIDGCSAPSPGITLTGAGLYIHGPLDPSPACPGGCDVHDVIVRNIRTRATTSDRRSLLGPDGFRVAYGAHDIVFDHDSANGAGDGDIDVTENSYNVTVDWSIFSAPKSNHAIMFNYKPYLLTMNHDLIMKSADRNPYEGFDYDGTFPSPCYCPAGFNCNTPNEQCSNSVSDPSLAQTTLDFWNNIVWNWGGGRGTITWYHAQSNIVNNYYNSPGGDNPDGLIVCSDTVPSTAVGDCTGTVGTNAFGEKLSDVALYRSWAYVTGNFNPDLPSVNAVGSGAVATSFPGQPPSDPDACTAAKNVLGRGMYPTAGALPLDTVDQANIAAVTLPGCS